MHQPPEINLKTSSAFADAFYSGVQLVATYMKERSEMIQSVLPKPDTPNRDTALQGLWLRALAWMQSLEALNHTKHFQAIAAGNRALLEILVDVVLLHTDKTNLSGWKMHWWAQSEKLKGAASIVNFFNSAGLLIHEVFEAQEIFYKNEKQGIELMRRQLWNRDDHPRRWSGRSDLSRDVEEADRLLGPP